MKIPLATAILAFLPTVASSQPPEPPPFRVLMDMARIKRIVQVDTEAGKTHVLVTSIVDNPAFVFVFQPGGEGTLLLGADAAGAPATKRPRNPAYYFAPAFLERQAAWAAVDVPESFGVEVSRPQRRGEKHVNSMAQVGRRLREEFPGAKLVIIGHSNGGITAGMLSVQDKPVYDGFVFSAPNLSEMPAFWSPRQAKAPVKFITHENDDCGSQNKRASIATLTKRAAGREFPLTVITTPSPGSHQECFAAPAPHFFTQAYAEYTDAIMKWVAGLK
jgi:pimeloyl-ACP methyl ester carboxylesterase